MTLGIFTLVIGGISVLSNLGSSTYIDVISKKGSDQSPLNVYTKIHPIIGSFEIMNEKLMKNISPMTQASKKKPCRT